MDAAAALFDLDLDAFRGAMERAILYSAVREYDRIQGGNGLTISPEVLRETNRLVDFLEKVAKFGDLVEGDLPPFMIRIRPIKDPEIVEIEK